MLENENSPESGNYNSLRLISELAQHTANVLSELDLRLLSQRVIDSVVNLLKIDAALLALKVVNNGTGEEQMEVLSCSQAVSKLSGQRFKKGERLSGIVWEKGTLLTITAEEYKNLIPDALEFTEFKGKKISAIAVVPVVYDNQVVGIINVFSLNAGFNFGESDIFLLKTFADYVSIAYRNASLYHQENTRNAELLELKNRSEADRQLVEIVLDQMADALLVINTGCAIIKANKAAGYYFKTSPEELIGLKLDEIRPFLYLPDNTPITSNNCMVERSIKNREVITNQEVIYRNDTDEMHLIISIAPILKENNEIYGAVITMRDITTVKQLQDIDTHRERLRSLGQLAGGVAHDINNLLSSIMGATDIIKAEIPGGDNSRLTEAIQMIQQVGSDGAQMVRRIQTFTRTTEPGIEEPVSLSMVVNEALKLTEPRWKTEAIMKGTRITIDADITVDYYVMGNPAELREVLINLLLNAVDALTPAGGHILIKLKAESSNQVRIIISDNGTGIPDHLKERVFEPFFTTKGQAGTGLGLAIVKNIVERLNGTIWVESEVGRGTDFNIQLPVVSPNLQVDKGSISHENMKLASDNTHLKILAIDDEPVLSRILGRMLDYMGHEAVTFNDPEKAIQYLQQNPDKIDVVITDLGMPKMTGWDVANAVNKIRENLPVILVTGWSLEDSAETLNYHKVSALITKPYTSQHLLEALRCIPANHIS
jgi:PAS domain S-box-containing protein